jgi:hypothetical protein
MSNHSELRGMRLEIIHFKNKYNFMILKITLMLQLEEEFVGFKVNTKSALQYPFELRSDVSFAGTIF